MRKVLKSLQAAFFRTSQKPSEFLRSRRNSARVKGVKTFELKLELTEWAEIYRKVLPGAENVVLGQGRALFFCSAVSAAVYIYDIIPHFRPRVKADVKNTRKVCEE